MMGHEVSDTPLRRTRLGGRLRHLLFALSALLGLALVVLVSGCGGENEEAKSPDSVDHEQPSKLSPMEQLQAIPKDLKTQADDLTKPIDDVQKVIDQLTSIPKRYGLNAADMMTMAQATLASGTVNLKLGADVSDAAKTEVETALNTLKEAVAGLKATPDKVAALVTKIATLSSKVPALIVQVTAGATAAAANPFAGADAIAKAKGCGSY